MMNIKNLKCFSVFSKVDCIGWRGHNKGSNRAGNTRFFGKVETLKINSEFE